LKLVFSGLPAGLTEFEIPGGTIRRGPAGEVPGGRWVRTGQFGFASDALYNFDTRPGKLGATIVRGARFAAGTEHPEPWRPTMDQGELKFRFLVTPTAGQLPRLARELEQPPIVQTVPAKPGRLPRAGSVLELPASLRLLALKPAEDGRGWILRVQGQGDHCVWLGRRLRLPATGFSTWRLTAGRAARVRAALKD
jgi:alpha-mannosidase